MRNTEYTFTAGRYRWFWMLQRHLLVQLHTYIFFVPPVARRKKKVSEEWNIFNGTLQRSPSFSGNASVTSKERFTQSTSVMLVAQLSKRHSAEFITEATEEHIPGRVAQSVTCLSTDGCLTADPGVSN